MRARLLKKGLKVAIVGCSMLLVPFSVSAKQDWQSPYSLLELDTLAGGKVGYEDGTVEEASFSYPTGIVQLSSGELIITDSLNHRLRIISKDTVSTYSGSTIGFDESGDAIGAWYDAGIEEALYQSPTGITVSADNTLYIADSANHVIRKISNDGKVTTIAGNGLIGLQDGKGKNARLYSPSDVAVDQKGNVYVADTLNHVIRKIDATGVVTTLTAESDRNVEYSPGSISEAGDYKDGKISKSKFNEPTGLAIDQKGNLYVADKGNQRIRYIDFKQDSVTTIAGSGDIDSSALYAAYGYVDGKARDAKFNSPEGISLARDGTLLIADRNNHTIRAFKDGQVRTVAGIGEEYDSIDGVLSGAKLNEPTDVIELQDGRLAIAESAGHKIRLLQTYKTPEFRNSKLMK